jgi:hypothetical protein
MQAWQLRVAFDFETLVLPAKAGIQPVDIALQKVCGADFCFRENDRRFESEPSPNHNST